MKRALAFALFMAGTALDAGEIVQKPLDEFVIYNLPVACQSSNTTVLFPSTISGLYAKSVAAQEQPNADFLLSFTPGNFYFTVRALKKDADDHLTVIFNRKAYVLHLKASDKPFYSVRFFQGGGTRAATRPLSRAAPFASRQGEGVSAFPEGPHRRAGWRPPLGTWRDKLLRQFQGDHPRLWRFEEEDTLVFRVDLENTSESTIYYKPQDLAVRLEERIYTQSIADASGAMAPKSSATDLSLTSIRPAGNTGGGAKLPGSPHRELQNRGEHGLQGRISPMGASAADRRMIIGARAEQCKGGGS